MTTMLRCLGRGGLLLAGGSRTTATRLALAPQHQHPHARSLHKVPRLKDHDELVRNGVPNLLTPKAFEMAYTDYMTHIVSELNESTAGTPWEGQETKALVLEFARDPARAYAFNVASMAFNNHFFFHGLAASPDVHSRPAADLEQQLRKDFSSLDTLRVEFLATAEAMFGPGFVWLVQTNATQLGSLRIVPTYLAGSPLAGAHYRRQSEDLNTHSPDSYRAVNKVGSFGGAAAARERPAPTRPLGGVDVVPLLCVNTWEHVWLHDYGVAGKRRFLEAWWDKINWDLVRQNAVLPSQSTASTRSQFLYPPV